MALFTWNSSYSVDIPEIDKQHQQLVGMLNELFASMQAGKSNDVLGKLLNNLISYTKTHFAYEEKLMTAKKYPEYAAHKAEHDALAKKVLDLQQQFTAGKVTLSIELGKFLKEWLSNHILGTDKKYSAALK